MAGEGTTMVGVPQAARIDALAKRHEVTSAQWRNSPAGLSAMGFGRVNSSGGREAIDALKAEKAARDARR